MADLSLAVVNTPADRRRLADTLSSLIAGEVRFDDHDRMLYSTDASIYQVPPIGVVVPRHVDDIVAVVRHCGRHRVPILPRGAGTSLAGQTVNEAVVIDCSRHCGRLLEVDTERRTARVEPGLVLDELNRRLQPHGLMFGPDVATATHANLGGMIGNNSAGARSVLYGRTVEHLHAIEAVLPDGRRLTFDRGAAARDADVAHLTDRVAAIVRPLAGEIRDRFPTIRRRVDGYNLDLVLDQLERSSPGTFDDVNLAHLLCGSEGTLATTLAATVGLVPRPAHTGLAIVAFASVDDALESVVEVLESGPSAVELIDDVVIDVARANLEYRTYLDLLPMIGGGLPGAVLYVEYFADEAAAIDERVDHLRKVYGAERVSACAGPVELEHAWKLRKAGEPLLHGVPGSRKPLTFIEDTAVDPGRLAEFVRRFRAIVERHGTTAAYYAHASVGCLHIRPLIDPRRPADLRAMRSIAEEATSLVLEFHGALSGEHGDGRLRSPLLERFYGRAICDAFAAIKAVFDPVGIMNPGNITRPEAMTSHLRVSPENEPLDFPEVDTWFTFEREHGFRAAVEMCNGAGVCRRRTGGTMCPSYRATLDERHATRGRANALRLAISGQLGDAGSAWQDPETMATLDLCLSCKACKSECPSSVDVARLKAEYLQQGYRRTGRIPLATRLVADVRRLNRIGALFPGFANVMAGTRAARWAAGRLIDLDDRRRLPPFGRALTRRLASRRDVVPRDDAPAVVLLPDCFTAFGESDLGVAAVGVLERLGYRVVVPSVGCCGRSAISVGLLEHAVGLARDGVERIESVVRREQVVAVVGLEPSCVSAIVDDWPALRLDIDPARVRTVAEGVHLFEDFIERRWDEHPDPPVATRLAGDRPLLVHGHCHQKALWGTADTRRLLERIAGDRVEVIDSGCCGMAGSFGYTKDHYDLSMAIGELALFPAVRDAPDATIVAPGTSCRQQLLDALNVRAVHPVELLHEALAEGSRLTAES